ncbi:MAG: hypothetical protein R3Y45_01140 [Bacillota bacterium]
MHQIYDINKITKKDETSSNNGNPSSSANRTTWDVNVSSTDSILNKTKKVNPHSQNNSKNNTKYDLADDFRELTDADVSNMGTNYHSKISQFYELNGIKKEDAKLAQSNDLKFANTDIKTVFMNVILMLDIIKKKICIKFTMLIK